jgi:hypothetical protein
MCRRCTGRAIGVAFVLLTVLTGTAAAQMFVATGRDTLRGLPGVEVVVEALQPELEREGLTTGAIREDVMRQLRAAGIMVYASQAENPSPAKPFLYIHVNGLAPAPSDVYVIALQVHLRQTLQSPVTGSNIVNAMTWDAHNVLSVPAVALLRVREEIQDYVDTFIQDWLAVR